MIERLERVLFYVSQNSSKFAPPADDAGVEQVTPEFSLVFFAAGAGVGRGAVGTAPLR